ncbi:ATP-binding cassette domain-containing protein [Streptomyces sp. NPDC058773]|uniref:ATP-binding cassette domain-containing protein n=1 Tax=Streptomyces sp. NPDC058773 TaxID=3346632 RepID=UPI0036AD2D97
MARHQMTGRASGRTAIEAVGLGKRYRRHWALRDCTFRLPAGRICALVGPSGAGKSTLLSLVSGLARPREGAVRVWGEAPAGAAAHGAVAHLAQGKPRHPRLTVAERLRLGGELHPGRWSRRRAERIVQDGRIPLDARVGALTIEQRTRLGLALAFARSPELLLLDEPLAGVDPLVRHRIAALLLAQAAEHGTTVVLSSDLLAELDGVCDYLLVLGGGRVRLAGEVDDVIGAHALVMGQRPGEALPPEIAAHPVVEAQLAGRHFAAVVRRKGPVAAGAWEAVEPSLEELLLAYLRAPDAPDLIAPSAEPVSASFCRRPGNKPGIPGLPRNGTPGPAGLRSTWKNPPDSAPRARHTQHSGKGAAA